MHYELMWAFWQAVGLSAISLLALPAPISRSHFPLPIPIPNPVPNPHSHFPLPISAWLAKDAASIPNATEILKLKTLTIKEIPKSS